MPRFKLFVEYQGTRYSGWQIQKNARTVQGEIQSAVTRITSEGDIELYGSGRTDAGVHALRQVAHLDLKTAVDPDLLQLKINDELPKDIHILAIERVQARFHARHHAVGRSYLYQICRRRTAFGKNLVWWVKEDLDVNRMRRAASLFTGMRDFQFFAADDPEVKSTRVLIDGIRIEEAGDLILIRIEGSHFLWKMVRRIVGVIVEAGKGRLSQAQISRFLSAKSDQPSRLAAPASGLFLECVYYEGDPRPERLEPAINITSARAPGRRIRSADSPP